MFKQLNRCLSRFYNQSNAHTSLTVFVFFLFIVLLNILFLCLYSFSEKTFY